MHLADNVDNTVTFTYRIKDGCSAREPYAHLIARHAGLSDTVITRALDLLRKMGSGEEIEVVENTDQLQRENMCCELVNLFEQCDLEDTERTQYLIQELQMIACIS